MKNAIISVYNKCGIDKLVDYLVENNYTIWSSGGTYRHIQSHLGPDRDIVREVSTETGFPEILNGRVKTLHPRLYGGILADRELEIHRTDMSDNGLKYFDLVVVNLYPFRDTIRGGCSESDAIENIDIGGVSLIRAAAKNYKYLSVLVDESQYDRFVMGENSIEYRRKLAGQAYRYITLYDRDIATYFNPDLKYREYERVHDLKYGLNPSQKKAFVSRIEGGVLPFRILNGSPGYINMIDMIQSWRLVCEVTDLTGDIAVTSFKHTTPTGLALATPITDEDREYFNIRESNTSLVAVAYMRARDVDPLSSFGDFVAVSGIVDYETALAIRPEVTDGIIALGYEPEALEILKKKKGGRYIILIGRRELPTETVEFKEYGGGLCLVEDTCQNIVRIKDLEGGRCSKGETIPSSAAKNMIIANTVLKYTPSNSVAFSYKNMVLGVGAGQQNRVDCVKLAGDKFTNWLMRHHENTIEYRNSLSEERNSEGKKKYKRQSIINKVYDFVSEDTNFSDKDDYLKTRRIGISVASDGFFPFPDGVETAGRYNAEYVIQPGGSVGDPAVIEAAESFGMTMVMTGKRMFFH